MSTTPPDRPGSARARAWPRRLAAIGGVVAALFAIWLIVCTTVLLDPEVTEDPHPADAVFILGPSDQTRVDHARDLMDQGLAPTVVYATPQGDFGDGSEATTDEIHKPQCEMRDYDYEVICFEPDPSTTQGEAIKMRDLAAERGWDDIIVITMRPHVPRAQLIVERCYDGATQWSPIDYVDSYWQHPWMTFKAYVYQSAGFLKAWVTPGCETQLPGEPKSL
ncbi:YdcF family protein [Kocuria palustris]|uniref:YdcF family protein n=1 Tax=Kocuria palustris TaxID=71999 RepID=UPI0016430EC1|nr:YdcF family protein [Kocuria palustris]